jgi:hypothetical protein
MEANKAVPVSDVVATIAPVAAAYPVATAGKNSYTTYRNADETSRQSIEDASILECRTAKRSFVSGATMAASVVFLSYALQCQRSFTSLLSAATGWYGLAFKNDLNRYQLAVDPTYTVDDAAQF